MDSSQDPFPDPHAKKSDQSTPVKRPRQKHLQFDFVGMQQRGHYPTTDLTRPMPNNSENPSFQTGDVSRWFHEDSNHHYPRRDTPVPDAEGLIQSEDELWEEIQSLLEAPAPEELHPSPPGGHMDPSMATGLNPWTNARPTQPFGRMDRTPQNGMMPTMNYPFLNEAPPTDRNSVPPFASSRTERARFMELMNPQGGPQIFDSNHTLPPPVDLFPPVDASTSFRKNPPPSPQRQDPIRKESEEFYNDFSSFGPREWNSSGMEAKLPAPQMMMDHRFRHMRRSKIPQEGLKPDPPQSSAFLTQQNSLFDHGYPDPNTERSSGRISVMRERLRRLDHRQSPLEDTREQEIRATMERHRSRQSLRERRSPCRQNDFGALMSALGLVPDDDGSSNSQEGNSRISRVREAMVGIMNSRLPPQLLFSDRDFDGDDYELLSRLDDSVESKKGADDKIINKICLCSFTPENNCSNSGSGLDYRCPICLENFASGVEIRVMPCQHKYHRRCLDKWLKINAVCPICNMNIKDKFHEDPAQHHN